MPDASGLMRKCKNSNLLLVNVNLNKKLGKQCFAFTEDNDLEYEVHKINDSKIHFICT